jgi:peptidyl-prolyl cis-trans isomerase A (cyclophilin A)
MARTSEVDSATAQFFINHADNAPLNYKSDREYGYAVFVRVIEGMNVVDKIAAVRTTNRAGHENVPVDVIEIKTAKRR